MGKPIADKLLREAIALVQKHGTAAAAAVAAGIPPTTLRSRLALARVRKMDVPPVETSPKAARGALLSEDERKFHPEWGPAECLAELRRVAEIDDTKVITRNYFRVFSDISESTWNRYFGTFDEFKRQARIILSRGAHRLERAIAKHASTINQRTLNVEKRAWEGTYARPHSRRWQSSLVISDIHDLDCDPFYRRVVLDTVPRLRPEKITIDGDIFDLPEFSKYGQDPRDWRLMERIRWVHAFLSELREAAPDAQIDIVEGNHEFRLLRWLAENDQPLMVILAELHGFTIPKLLGLDKYEVNFIARADLSAWTEKDIKEELRKNYVIQWDALLFGHFPEMRAMGFPGANGHHHKHIVTPFYSPTFGPAEWHQLGCGHVREASYCAGEKFSNGFLIAHCDTHTKRSQFEYLDLSHPHAVVGGRFYERLDTEPVLDLPSPSAAFNKKE